MNKESGKDIGINMADALIGWLHKMYNKQTALRVLNSLMKQLEMRRKEFE